ncbi:MAG: prepilin-type N-terminal cleavage/methylation domain-containing protein [Chloroflexi bacterium]|nr:prepilin-type N-terminal cleavage/methylation domain-containing protein [Chloroflexota bacterium]
MKTQGGFTLIELLVVIAILAVLFGVTALALNGVGSNAATVTAAAEKDVVQTAIDVWMTQNPSTSLTTNLGATVVVSPTTTNFGQYLRRASKYGYCWNASGVLSQTLTVGDACP